MSSDEEEEDNRSIVIDNGTGTIKAGFTGDDAPLVVFPSIIGRSRPNVNIPKKRQQNDRPSRLENVYVGDETQHVHARGKLSLTYPIDDGTVASWDDMEKIWCYTHTMLDVFAPEEHPILLTDIPGPLNSKYEDYKKKRNNREKMAQIMFETFNVPAMYVGAQSVFALFASGRTTGIVLDCGYGVSQTVPIYEGSVLPYCISRLDLAGSHLMDYLMKMLSVERGYTNIHTKEKRACSFKVEVVEYNDEQRRYLKLPDGKEIDISDEELQRCGEVLFNPKLFGDGNKSEGIHKLVYNSIMEIDEVDLRKDLYGGIVLNGGSTMFPGFDTRLTEEMTALAPESMEVKIVAPPDRQYSAWIGGSVLASVETFQDMWISKDEYDESGMDIVHKKCIF